MNPATPKLSGRYIRFAQWLPVSFIFYTRRGVY